MEHPPRSPFDYYAPLTEDEREVVEHESAHAVTALAVPNDCVLADTLVFPMKDESCMIGQVQHINLSSDPERPYDDMPPFASTMPHRWREAAILAWGSLLVFYAGPAQSRIFFELDLTGPSIRGEPCGANDDKYAGELCRHFWKAEHAEGVLDLAAHTAGVLTSLPAFQGAIRKLADFLTENKRRKASGMEASVIVRPFIAAAKPAPFTREVLQWIKWHE